MHTLGGNHLERMQHDFIGAGKRRVITAAVQFADPLPDLWIEYRNCAVDLPGAVQRRRDPGIDLRNTSFPLSHEYPAHIRSIRHLKGRQIDMRRRQQRRVFHGAG